MSRDSLPDGCACPTHAERMAAVETAREDPGLTTIEKEFLIKAAKDQQHFKVYSEIGSVTRNLLAHPHVGIKTVRVSDDERFGARLTWDEWQDDGGPITGVEAYIPAGLLKISANPRASNQFNQIVSNHNGGDSP